MAAGIMLAQYYIAEALRLFDARHISVNLRLAQKILHWLLETWTEPLIPPDIYQLGPNAVREKALASKVVGILEDHGWLVQVPGGAEVLGHRRRDVWRIVKS